MTIAMERGAFEFVANAYPAIKAKLESEHAANEQHLIDLAREHNIPADHIPAELQERAKKQK